MSVRLALDAATDRLSLAADRDGGTPVSVTLDGARRHAGALLPLIDGLLARLAAHADDVTLVAVADGPGSFTGLRVSFAAAKALAFRGAALLTAPSLMLRAAAAAAGAERILALSPALRGEVYAGAWRIDCPKGIEELMEPRTVGPGDLALLPSVDRVVGDGPAEILTALGASAADPPDATVLLRLIGVPGGAREVKDAAGFEPRYGRPAEAVAKWEREHGRPLPDPDRHAV